MEVSDQLLCLFNTQVEQRNGRYVIEVPERELEHGDIDPEAIYRIAVLESVSTVQAQAETEQQSQSRQQDRQPPVEEGETRTVEIKGLGDQGDGIAKVERGFVIIVPGAGIGEEVTVEITNLAGSYAIGEIIDRDVDNARIA